MNIVKLTCRLSKAEQSTTLNYDSELLTWVMDTTVMKHYNKAKKQGWKQIAEYYYQDGSVCGGQFEAPGRCVTFRNIEKKETGRSLHNNLIKARAARKNKPEDK